MKTRAVILAGGEGARLSVLTARRAQPAVPFAGKYRIIDFTLSNCVNSGIFDVIVVTQYYPHSLHEHIAGGRPWDLDRGFTGGIQICHPYRDRGDTGWYAGTADAVYQNLDFIRRGSPDLILLLSGDHIYEMDYEPLVAFHCEKRSDLTIASIRVTPQDAQRLGIMMVDAAQRLTHFVEKPQTPPTTLASMGIYVFNREILEQVLTADAHNPISTHDFGRDVIPAMLATGRRIYAYPYTGYWMDVGTLDAYWRAHMDLIFRPIALDLSDSSWVIYTKSESRPPAIIQEGAQIKNSLISDGVIIAPGAVVERSVLSPGVYIGPAAIIRESILFNDVIIEAGARVERAILDKQVTVGHNAHVGQITNHSHTLGITSIGKGAQIPSAMWIPRGAVIAPDASPDYFPLLTDKDTLFPSEHDTRWEMAPTYFSPLSRVGAPVAG